MRKWSKQGFLNPADSNDDGWYKFSIRPLGRHRNRTIGFNMQYIISDCSNKIYLEFEPDMVSINDDGSAYKVGDALDALKDIKARRKKMKDWVAAVNLAGEKLEEAMDTYEAQVLDAIDKARNQGVE